MRILIPDTDTSPANSYRHDLAHALEGHGQEVLWGDDRFWDPGLEVDVIASQWPEGYFRSSLGGAIHKRIAPVHVRRLRSRLKELSAKTVIVSTIHNVRGHFAGRARNAEAFHDMYRAAYEASHGRIHLGKATVTELAEAYPAMADVPVHVTSLGLHERLAASFDPLRGDETSGGFEVFVPGDIRFIEELRLILRGFDLADIPGKRLVIGGGGPALHGRHPIKPLRRLLASMRPGVTLIGRYLEDEEFRERLLAASVILSPRIQTSNSAIPFLAATFGRRCIGPAVGNLAVEIPSLGGIVFDPSSPKNLARALERAWRELDDFRMPNPPCPTWREIAGGMIAFYEELRGRGFGRSSS